MLDPLTIERMTQVSGGAPIVVALSGGGDSVALLHLLVEQIGASRLHALVVDHALRAGSELDAARARSFAGEVGVAVDVLTVRWPNGIKRGQAAARDARYAVLSDRARELGAKVIAVAHTADDQIETLLMRAAAGSSWRGLGGMAPFAPTPIWPEGKGLWLARPLLQQRRETLRDYLREQSAEWIEDPANANDQFERVRTRAQVREMEAAGKDVMRLTGLAARIRPHVEAVDAEAVALIVRAACFEGATITIDHADWSAPDHIRRRALSALLTAASGSQREPSPDAVERLDARTQAQGFQGASLGGAMVAIERDGFRITRDPGALIGRADGVSPLSPLSLEPARVTVWDGRLELCIEEPGWSVVATSDGAELRRANERRAVAALIAQNSASWLLRRRVAHLLGEHN